MALITASEYKVWAGISVSTYDTRLAVLIPAVQARAERFCNRGFDYATGISEVIDGTGASSVVVSRPPIASLTSVVVDLGWGGTATYTTDALNYDTTDMGRIWFPSPYSGTLGVDDFGVPLGIAESPSFPLGRGNVTVTYAGGYGGAGATVPDDLKLTMYESVAEAMSASTPAGVGSVAMGESGTLKSQTLGRISETYGDPGQREQAFRARWQPWWRPPR